MKTLSAAALGLLVVLGAIQCSPKASKNVSEADADSTITVAFDYAGAEALLIALERPSLTTADVDALLRIHGVRAMVDNVHRFFPEVGEADFRREIQSFVRTKKGSELEPYFQLGDVWRARGKIRSLVAKLRKDETGIQRRMRATLAPYRPNIEHLDVTCYFVAGGVSDGFVPDNTSGANFYANLARAKGSVDDEVGNLTHETYHLVQKAAQRRTRGLEAIADSIESQPGPVRLLATTLAEGTATLIVEKTSADRARVQQNFAVFDTVLAGLRSGTMDWDTAYRRGFTGEEDERFYVLGYEMAKVIEQYCGRSCIGSAFERPPIEFFREYIRIYREHPDVVGRFSPETEASLAPDH